MPENKTIELEQWFAEHPALLGQIKSDGSVLQEMLLQEADESDFSLADWVDSLNVLYHWLEQGGLTLPLQDGLGYVSCAAKSVGSSSALNHLPSLVHDFLDQYGCELAVNRGTI